MAFDSKDRIRGLISQVTEANLHNMCGEIHHYIQLGNYRKIIQAIAVSVVDEAAGHGHTLVPQYLLAGVCWKIHKLCSTPGEGAGASLSISLPKTLNEVCQEEFVDANRKLESDEGVEVASSTVLDLVVLVGELYKLGLVEDGVMERVYFENLHCDDKASDVRAQALCLLLELVATRWDIEPTSRNTDVEQHILSLLDYAERHDAPSELVEEIQGIATQFGVQARPRQPPSSSHSSSSTPTQNGQPHASPQSTLVAKKHPVYFFRGGDVDLICQSDVSRTIFRVHIQQLVGFSPVMSDLLSRDVLHQLPVSDGRPQIHWDDDPMEFALLLEALYTPRLPFGANGPPFHEFASLLRLSTKYQINKIRHKLLENFSAPSQNAEGFIPIYRGYFGDPEPHPNEVLRLFYECQVESALPFAFYEACVTGIKSLTNTDPSIILPPVPLSRAVRGFYTLQEWEWKLAKNILFLDRQSHTSKMCRPLDVRSTNSGSPLQDVLRAARPGSGLTAGGILHILDFPDEDNCVSCVRRWNDIKEQAKVELWKSLPEIFGMGSWTEIYSEDSNRAT